MVNAIKKPSWIWRTVLVVSLGLNVAVVGATVGMVASGRAHDGPPQRMMFDFGPLGRVLEPEDRRAIGQSMRKGGARPITRGELDGKIALLATTLRAMPFDVGAVGDIMGSFQRHSEQIQQKAQGAFLAHLAAMTPEARAALADRLEQKRRRGD